MSQSELFFNRLGVKLITEDIKLSELEEKEIEPFFADKNKHVEMGIQDIEESDKKLLDTLILTYGELGAMVKVECLISDIRTTREKMDGKPVNFDLWLLLVSLKEFKVRLGKLCVIDIERILLVAFLHYTNGKSAVVLDEFIERFGNKKLNVKEALGLDTEEEVKECYQFSLLDGEVDVLKVVEEQKEDGEITTPLSKAVSRRQKSSSVLFKMLSKAQLIVEFIDFGNNLTEEFKKSGTMEAKATSKVISVAISDILDSSKYQVKNKDKYYIPEQLAIKPIRK